MDQVWVALIRGINVGGHKALAMADLRALLESLGYGDVRTHLQSGNALFTTARASALALEGQISSRIHADLGLSVRVLIRSAPELAAVVDGNPFVADGVDPKQLMVSFLSEAPTAAQAAGIDPGAYAPDAFKFGKRVIYLHLPNGFMESRLPDFDRLLGVTVTTRTWRTVTRLRELSAG
jgi:uncharacterized protein (DUF1697 family)